MIPRLLRVIFLLFSVFSVCSFAQSLGDIARQNRAEQQKRGGSHPKVITNDDLSGPKVDHDGPKAVPTAEGGAAAKVDGSVAGTTKEAKTETGADETKSPTPKETANEVRELEKQKRTEAIQKEYTDRIAGLRSQIDIAEKELARLQRDQVESTNEFRRSVGTYPSIATYEQQQTLFADQISAQRNSISALKSKLEDTQEEARHAGVRHTEE